MPSSTTVVLPPCEKKPVGPVSLDVQAAVGDDRQVGGHVQVGELRAEAGVGVGPAAGGGPEEGSIGAGDEDRVETPGQFVGGGLGNEQAELAGQEFIAEAVH